MRQQMIQHNYELPTEDDRIPPFRYLTIAGHKTGVNVRLLIHRSAGLDPDLFAVEQKCVRNGGCDGGE